MRKTSKKRIMRILEKNCIMTKATLSHPVKDEYGDIAGYEQYAECDIYFSQLLHRYSPYVGVITDDDNIVCRRRTPMAIIPYDKPLGIEMHDTAHIDGADYTVNFTEDMKGYYYLLSLTPVE